MSKEKGKNPREDESALPVVMALGLTKTPKGYVVLVLETQGATVVSKELVTPEAVTKGEALQKMQIEFVTRFLLGRGLKA